MGHFSSKKVDDYGESLGMVDSLLIFIKKVNGIIWVINGMTDGCGFNWYVVGLG